MNSIDIETLKMAFNNMLTFLDDQGIDSVPLDDDFYWTIDYQQRFDVNTHPAELDIGQLYDDWSEVQRIAAEPDEVISYGLIWFASICRYVGEKLVY